VAAYNLVTPAEMTVVGRVTGSTVLNLWFTDEGGQQSVLSYLVRVFPPPGVSQSSYRVGLLDEMLIEVADSDLLPKQPLTSKYTVTLDGEVKLRSPYGKVKVAGMTLEQLERAIGRHLADMLKSKPPVNVTLIKAHGSGMRDAA